MGTLNTIESDTKELKVDSESQDIKQIGSSQQNTAKDYVSSQRVDSYYGPQTAQLHGKQNARYDGSQNDKS